MRATLLKSVMIGLIVVLAGLMLAGCSRGKSSEESTATPVTSIGTPNASPIVSGSPTPSPTPVGPAPSPATIDFASLKMIDEWRSEQIPAYPDAKRRDWKPEGQASVENAGTMLWETTDPADNVIAFYRAALPFLGWKEDHSTSAQMVATSDTASLVISVIPREGGTQVIMMLSDKLG